MEGNNSRTMDRRIGRKGLDRKNYVYYDTPVYLLRFNYSK